MRRSVRWWKHLTGFHPETLVGHISVFDSEWCQFFQHQAKPKIDAEIGKNGRKLTINPMVLASPRNLFWGSTYAAVREFRTAILSVGLTGSWKRDYPGQPSPEVHFFQYVRARSR